MHKHNEVTTTASTIADVLKAAASGRVSMGIQGVVFLFIYISVPGDILRLFVKTV